jgi:hypothetical protein
MNVRHRREVADVHPEPIRDQVTWGKLVDYRRDPLYRTLPRGRADGAQSLEVGPACPEHCWRVDPGTVKNHLLG